MSPTLKLKVRAADFDIDLPGLTFLQVLEAEVSAIQKLDGTARWLLVVLQNIWLTKGSIYHCAVSENLDNEADTSGWQAVNETDELRAGHYEFRKDIGQIAKAFTRIENKSDTSATNDSQHDKSRAFRRNICARDGSQCVVTGLVMGLKASHIVPKRLGDVVTRKIFNNRGYSGDRLDRWSPENGLYLSPTVDTLFDHFLGSFYPLTESDHYTFHSFDVTFQRPQCVFAGGTVFYDIHQKRCVLSVLHDVPIPPVAILSWHYTQAALKAFATSAFRRATTRFLEIRYREETGSTDDSHYTFDINDSTLVRIQHAMYVKATSDQLKEKDKAVEQWLSSVTDARALNKDIGTSTSEFDAIVPQALTTSPVLMSINDV